MATIKQLEALAKGRAAREKQLNKKYGKQYAELIARNRRLLKDGEKSISYENIKSRIKYAQREHEMMTGKKLSREKAIKSITFSTAFMSRDEIYMRAIRDYMTLGDKNRLRSALSRIQETNYKETTINWNEFYYDKGLEAMIHVSGKITLSIKHGADSTQEDFVEIREI